MTLTHRQYAVAKWIGEFYAVHLRPASVREIAAAFGIKSPTGCQQHLNALAAKGAIVAVTPFGTSQSGKKCGYILAGIGNAIRPAIKQAVADRLEEFQCHG